MQKTEYKKTELLGIIKAGMKELEDKCEDMDIGYFNESDHCCPKKFYHSVSCLGPLPSGTLAVRSV